MFSHVSEEVDYNLTHMAFFSFLWVLQYLCFAAAIVAETILTQVPLKKDSLQYVYLDETDTRFSPLVSRMLKYISGNLMIPVPPSCI